MEKLKKATKMEMEATNGVVEGSREEEQSYDCTECGACCLHMCYPPYSQDERSALPEDIRFVVDWFDETDPRGSSALVCPCYFFNFKTRRCIVHGEHEPKVCADFEVGSEPCEHYKANVRPELDYLLNQVL